MVRYLDPSVLVRGDFTVSEGDKNGSQSYGESKNVRKSGKGLKTLLTKTFKTSRNTNENPFS